MILVAGSTGVLGFEICQRLRDRGQPVRALVRATSDRERVNALESLGCETVVGDLKDRLSLDAPCNGAQVVISTVTAITRAQQGDSLAATDGQGNVNLVDAAAAAKADQFLFVSFDSAGIPDSPLVNGKHAVEERLRQSGLAYTILHPGLFMESWLGPLLFADPVAGTATVYGTDGHRFRYISVGDVAEVTVRCVGNPAARDAVVSFGGPEAMTQREALDRFEEVFGKRFTVTEVPEAQLEARWQGAPDPFSRSFAALMLGVARGAAAGRETPEVFAAPMTTVKEFASRLHHR